MTLDNFIAEYLGPIKESIKKKDGPGVIPFSILFVTLHGPKETARAVLAGIPKRFFLVPLFEDGNLKLIPLSLAFLPAPFGWAVQNAMVTSNLGTSNNDKDKGKNPDTFELGISILLRGPEENLLALTWTTNNITKPTKGNWNSKLPPCSGSFDLSSLSWYTPKYLSAPFSWTFLLVPPPKSPSPNKSTPPAELPTTIGFNFVLEGIKNKFTLKQQGDSFPKGWKADPVSSWSATGLNLTIINENVTPEEKYKLSTGSFSGGLGHLVCKGNWTPDPPGTPADPGDGTWTGTSGGPI